MFFIIIMRERYKIKIEREREIVHTLNVSHWNPKALGRVYITTHAYAHTNFIYFYFCFLFFRGVVEKERKQKKIFFDEFRSCSRFLLFTSPPPQKKKKNAGAANSFWKHKLTARRRFFFFLNFILCVYDNNNNNLKKSWLVCLLAKLLLFSLWCLSSSSERLYLIGTWVSRWGSLG